MYPSYTRGLEKSRNDTFNSRTPYRVTKWEKETLKVFLFYVRKFIH